MTNTTTESATENLPEDQPSPEKPSKLIAFIKRLQGYSDRWWYLPLMGFLIFLDLFVVFIPSETILVKTVLLKPSRWFIAPLFLIFCSAVGAVALAACTHQWGEPFLNWLVGPAALQSKTWLDTEKFIADHGPWAMALISLGPFPQQPGVVLCGLGHMKLSTLFWAVFLGRAPKYFLFSFLAWRLPGIFKTKFKKILDF